MFSFFKKNYKALIAVVMLFFLYRSGILQIEKITASILDPRLLLTGAVLFTIQFVLFARRFQLVVTLLRNISFVQAFKLHLIGQFFNTFVPGGIGGDVVKAIELSGSEALPKRNTVALTLLDRILGLYAMICFSFFFLLIEFSRLEKITLKYLYVSALLFAIATMCFVFRNALANAFSRLHGEIKHPTWSKATETLLNFFEFLKKFFKPLTVFKFFIYSLGAQALSVLFLYVTVVLVNEAAPSFLLFFPLACFAFMAMAIPITPGGIGFGQAAFYFIFKPFGNGVADSVIVGVSLMQLFYILLSLPGGYYFTKKISDSRTTVP